uniref:Uncharacterized protein n=1 Tax=Pipistrellus kuhlii TaxID=59472 RepID=A0A7J8A875_PIPKU|nr:hypothetical protein mPipKuh1_008829 [Pipistrellus kuhlii]
MLDKGSASSQLPGRSRTGRRNKEVRGTPDLSQLEMFPHMVPFSFSQPHCTSDLSRKEYWIVRWSPALGQKAECSPQSCSPSWLSTKHQGLQPQRRAIPGTVPMTHTASGVERPLLFPLGTSETVCSVKHCPPPPTTVLSEACLPEVCLQLGVLRAKGHLLV